MNRRLESVCGSCLFISEYILVMNRKPLRDALEIPADARQQKKELKQMKTWIIIIHCNIVVLNVVFSAVCLNDRNRKWRTNPDLKSIINHFWIIMISWSANVFIICQIIEVLSSDTQSQRFLESLFIAAHIQKHSARIQSSSSRDAGLTVAFVERYQSGMGTWWLWNLRGTHFWASASHRSELRSGKLWWMSRPSWLQRPRDQPLSSEPWEIQKPDERSIQDWNRDTSGDMILTSADTNNGCFYSRLH